MTSISRVKFEMRKLLGLEEFVHLNRAVIELNNVNELRKLFGWTKEPIIDDPQIDEFDYVEDVNERRIRDAGTLATVLRNVNPSICLEIGTADGRSTALMAINAPRAQIFTVNIPPEEIMAGEGGKLTTIALECEKIGSYYRQRKLSNIKQIMANTKTWEPEIGTIDVAFVDGCHDTEFVYNDTRKILRHTKAGSFILWHDFNVELIRKYDWIHAVCLGVEKLFADKLITGRIFHVRDSWIGLHMIA